MRITEKDWLSTLNSSQEALQQEIQAERELSRRAHGKMEGTFEKKNQLTVAGVGCIWELAKLKKLSVMKEKG